MYKKNVDAFVEFTKYSYMGQIP